MPRGSRWVLSRRVALSYFLFALETPSGAASSGEAALQQQLSRQQEQLEALQKQCLSFFFYCFQILGMWCLHHLARSWCSNWIFVVFVCILCSSYSAAQQATYTVQACAGLSGRIKAAPFHSFYQQLEVGQDYFQRRCFKLDVVIRLAGCLQFHLLCFLLRHFWLGKGGWVQPEQTTQRATHAVAAASPSEASTARAAGLDETMNRNESKWFNATENHGQHHPIPSESDCSVIIGSCCETHRRLKASHDFTPKSYLAFE